MTLYRGDNHSDARKTWFSSVHLFSGSEQKWFAYIEEGEIYATDQLEYIQMNLAQPFHHLYLVAFSTNYDAHFLFLDRAQTVLCFLSFRAVALWL